MRYQKVKVIDTHTAGEPTRFILSGMPDLPGNTIMEKKNYMKTHEQADCFRRALMHEPRGHSNMFGALVLPACSPEADFGLIFIDTAIYDEMCGHGSIGAATLAVEKHMVPVREPVTEIKLDTPSGVVTTKVHVKNGEIQGVTLRNIPCFVYKQNAVVTSSVYGEIKGDIVFGGNFFFLIDADPLGICLEKENAPSLIQMGMHLMKEANAQFQISHPALPINEISIVGFFSSKTTSENAREHDFVVVDGGTFDRSPCGTATCARMAALHARNLLDINETYILEGVCDTCFTGRLIDEQPTEGGYRAVIPEITGNAYITAESTMLFDEKDPLKDGFLIPLIQPES